jgi:cobalt-zinc-cadmium efflux system membrane fusion protein
MTKWYELIRAHRWRGVAVAAAVVVALAGWWLFAGPSAPPPPSEKAASKGRAPAQAAKVVVELTERQAAAIQVGTVGQATFAIAKQAVGNIDFNQNRLVQVFTPYAGRIIAAQANVGDRVLRGQTLFTIDSPDLLTAESSLIAAAGVFTLQSRNLVRLKAILAGGGGAQKDVDQTTSDQQTAEGALKAARDAVRIFGKTEEEIDRIVAERRIDSVLVVRSPIAGLVTQRTAAPGLYVQPGSAPAPITVADTSTMWMVANVPEADSARLRTGQQVKVRVSALPDRTFDGMVAVVGASVDANTRRVMVRSEIRDPDGLLRAGMFATFTIQLGDVPDQPAVPDTAVVREADGSMTVWVTTDRRRFEKRTVKTGLRQRGLTQILEGLQPGELTATDGAVFISNKLELGAAD